MNQKPITFYPSQVAGLLGKNKYKDKQEEFDCLLHRYKTNEQKIIDCVDIPPKYESFIKKQITCSNSSRIKIRVDRLTCEDDVRSAIIQKIYTERGNINEDIAIKDYEKEMELLVDRPKHFIKKHLIFDNKQFFIGGKIDGMIINNKRILIEVKNRQNHFFNEIPEYERIQIECYMRMINADHCVFIQRFNDQNQVEIYYPNDDIWNDIVQQCSIIIDEIIKLL